MSLFMSKPTSYAYVLFGSLFRVDLLSKFRDVVVGVRIRAQIHYFRWFIDGCTSSELRPYDETSRRET